MNPEAFSIVAIGMFCSANTSMTAFHVRSNEAFTDVAARGVATVVGGVKQPTIGSTASSARTGFIVTTSHPTDTLKVI